MAPKAVFETNRAKILIAQSHVHPRHPINLFLSLCNCIGLLGKQFTKPAATACNQCSTIALGPDATAVDFFVFRDS